MNSKSLWRDMLYRELGTLSLNGAILDLGGYKESHYHALIGGEHTIAVADIVDSEGAEYVFDFEKPFLTKSESFDHILCINVLEHIFNYQNVLRESFRTLKTGGMMIVAVPFLMQVHPSPSDYWRFTDETLEKLFHGAGFKEVEVIPIGTGVFGGASQLTYNAMLWAPLRIAAKYIAINLDKLISTVKPHSYFSTSYYPLGYLVIAKK